MGQSHSIPAHILPSGGTASSVTHKPCLIKAAYHRLESYACEEDTMGPISGQPRRPFDWCCGRIRANLTDPNPSDDQDELYESKSTHSFNCNRHFVRRAIRITAFLLLFFSCVLGLVVYGIPWYDDALDPAVEVCISRLDIGEAERICLQQPQTDFIFTLTTLPRRLPFIQRTLKSLLLQSYCPRRIMVWVPTRNIRENTTYVIPDDILELNRTSSIISFHSITTDYGPATKLIPAIRYFTTIEPKPHQGVIALDDDVLYPRDLIQRYECYSRLLPESALTPWGCIYSTGVKPLTSVRGSKLNHPVPVDLMYGTASFFLRAGWLNPDELERFYPAPPEHARFEDDWYFSGVLALAGRTRFSIPISRRQIVQFDTLYINRGDLMNTDNEDNQHFDAMLDWYLTNTPTAKEYLTTSNTTQIPPHSGSTAVELGAICNMDQLIQPTATQRPRVCM